MQYKNVSLTSKPNKDHKDILRVALEKTARMVNHSPIEYNIVPAMREEPNCFEECFAPGSGVKWEAPIAHLIKRTPFATVYGGSCLHSTGGYSIVLQCVWWLKFPDSAVKQKLLQLKDNRDSNLISINVLKYLTVIINYCAAYVIVTTMDVTDDPHPVLLSMADNTSAHSRTHHTCKISIIGKLLAMCVLFSPDGL